MRWDQTARQVGRHLQRLCTQRRVISVTRKAQLSWSANLYSEDVTSALYVPGSKGTTVDGVVSPYLDFSKQFEDIGALERSISQRDLHVDLTEIVKKWSEWRELEEHKTALEEKRATITKALNALKSNPKNKDRISELKEHGKTVRNEVKALTHQLWDLQEVAVIAALCLPNNLHVSTGSDDKVLFSLSRKPHFHFQPKSHVDLGVRSRELEFVDNSPTAYYLKDRLALLELVCNDHFLMQLQDQGFSLMSNSDFVKAAIVEGCGIHHRDRPQHNELSAGAGHETSSHLHLVGGGSLYAFAAYFTKQIIEKSDYLPVKVATVGRHYSPASKKHPGLFGCRQSSVVDGFVLYEDAGLQERKLLEEVMVTMIQSYLSLGLHFQVVQYSAKKLQTHESAAIGFLMFSPHTEQYHEVGRISLCGDYISRRLWALCKKDKAASFLSMLHVQVCHTARVLALLMENMQEENSTYSVPGCLQSALDSY